MNCCFQTMVSIAPVVSIKEENPIKPVILFFLFTDLEKDVSKEEKQKLKSEAEEWVKTQIKDKPKTRAKSVTEQKLSETTKALATADTKDDANKVQNNPQVEQQELIQANASVNINASASTTQEFKTPTDQSSSTIASETDTNNSTPSIVTCADAALSSTKETDLDQASSVSHSVASLNNDSCASSVIQSSQESIGITMSHGDLSDPREDYEEEREERTNIKTTSERETFEQMNNEHSPGMLLLVNKLAK